MTKRFVLLLGFLSVLALSCNLAASLISGRQPTPAATVAAPASPPPAELLPQPTPTIRYIVVTSTSDPAIPTRQPTPTRTPTPPPTATPSPQQDLAQAMVSEYWPGLNLPADLATKWAAFADGKGALSAAELGQLEGFLAQWKMLNQAAQEKLVPNDASLALRVQVFEDGQGGQSLALYAVGTPYKSQVESPYLIARDVTGKAVGLVLAPQIPEMDQRISQDGQYVEYLGVGEDKVLLYADASFLNGARDEDTVLREELEGFYRLNHPYTRAEMFPRFFFPVEEIESGFFTIEKNLTLTQIVQMHEALALFERPALRPLKEAMYNRNVSVIILDDLQYAAGLTYIGTGVVELNRRDLFGNRYAIAEVLAHEGSHVLQGKIRSSNEAEFCARKLSYEVGDKIIPADFASWSAQQLLAGIHSGHLGAYHVSLWMFYQLGIKGAQIETLKEIIRTGTYNGHSVAIGCN